ncbi:MAG TPA: aldehyde dehydrogenase family protein [Gemmatimonadales bacterium]|jgi:aldehyde dehydrogenase (NAD+)|nr:aldehyde dehydrogenase family protein [Gemmatimonadales bacterium]
MTLLENFVNGAFVRGTADSPLALSNPSDRDDLIGSVPEGSPDDVRAAVTSARAAFDAWRTLPGPARAEHLYRWASAVDDERESLAQALAREVGKPIGEARGEIARCGVILRYYAGEAVRAVGEVVPAQAVKTLQFTLRDPLGVCALITPWNFPAAIPLWKAAPALAFGNTVVLKPAERASQTAVLLARTAVTAGLPPGVFNVVLGFGNTVGTALLEAADVRAVSFTGSTGVGAKVAAACAARNIRFQTEMGGKNVAIVLPDADLDLAARLTAAGAMRYAGQKCTATSRVVVQESVAGALLDRLTAEVRKLPLGPVTDAASAVGPLISMDARDRVTTALAAVEGRVVHGGTVPAVAPFARGNFVEPAIVADVAPDSPLAQDELFGPVLAAFTARDLGEAIAIANRTRYGLSASLFTRDLGAAMEYIRHIEAGLVRVNGDTTGVDPHAPFGGVKASSSGSREQGSAARDFYTEIRTVQVSA